MQKCRFNPPCERLVIEGGDSLFPFLLQQKRGAMKRLVTSEEISRLLGIPRTSVWYYVRSGILPHYRIGRVMRFDVDEVLAALVQQGDGTAGPQSA